MQPTLVYEPNKSTASVDVSRANVGFVDGSGTPLYMSPEQASGFDDVDGRADLYSLGAVAYHMLTGRPPFAGNSVLELVSSHRSSPPQDPSEISSGITQDVARIILQCLAKDPSQRYRSAIDLRSELEDCSAASQWDHAKAEHWWQKTDQDDLRNSEPDLAVTESFQS